MYDSICDDSINYDKKNRKNYHYKLHSIVKSLDMNKYVNAIVV